MKITFLGTGTSQGIPVIGCDCAVCQSSDSRDKRLRVSVHIERNNKSLVIDVGPDFRQQMLSARVERLDAVLLTHEHRDHISGIDDLRAYNFKQRMDMPIYARQRVLEDLRRVFAYAFSDYPGVPRLDLHSIAEEQDSFSVLGIEIFPVEYLHGKLPVTGYRIDDFAYITDIRSIEAGELRKLQNLDCLVISALHKRKHHSHLSLEEALEYIEELKPRRAYLTHLSHSMGLHAEVEKELPEGVFIAYDGLCIHVE